MKSRTWSSTPRRGRRGSLWSPTATNGLDLDAIAALSRSASELLDHLDTAPGSGTPYVLEVTSPGVERPLTSEKHYRRARGRKVELTLSDGSVLTGRAGGESTAALCALVVP